MNSWAKWRRGLISCVAFLAACGGDALILAIVVTPLNGNWSGQEGKESIRFVTDPREDLFSSNFPVKGVIGDPVNACGGELAAGELPFTGTYDNGKVVLYVKSATQSPCIEIEGRFTSMIRLEATATGARPARSYSNTFIAVDMGLGIWVSEGGETKLKFSDVSIIGNVPPGGPKDAQRIQACDVSPGLVPATLNGDLVGYDEALNIKPTISKLSELSELGQSAPPRYEQIEYTDGATITLRNMAGRTINLRRQKETPETSCP